MAKASDNPFPSTLLVEGSAPTSPASGNQRLFIDSSDHKLKRVNSSGTVTQVESAGGGLTAITEVTTPSTPAAGTQTLFIDSVDHHLKRINSSGTVTDLEAGGGGSSVASYFASTNGAGDISMGAIPSFTDVTGLSLSVAATAGDILIINTIVAVYTSGSGNNDAAINVAGTDVILDGTANMSTNTPVPIPLRYRHTVASGDISGGNVAVKTRVRGSSGSLSVYNSSGRKGTLDVLNLGH